MCAMIPARVSLITLGTRDLSAMRTFYHRLGWEEYHPEDEGFATFKTGGGVLALFPLDDLAREANLPIEGSRTSFKGVTLAVNVERAELVDQAIEAARSAGATVLRAPMDASWGGRSAYFADPENNVWEVAWAPNARFDERGGLIWS